MKVESSIKENYASTPIKPITDTEECIKAICEWNNISLEQFKEKVCNYSLLWKDINGNDIYLSGDRVINPIGEYLNNVYADRGVVFEKWNDKFFWTLKVRKETTRYMLWDKVIEIPFRIRAENEDTEEWITIFPKLSDFLQTRMRGLYVVNTGWAERQKLEKEIMAKLIELAQVKGWNEIIGTQNLIEELQANLKKSGIELELSNELLLLKFPRRKIRDTAWADREYIAPPIQVSIDFLAKVVRCKGYSPHGFWTPSSWWNPCWWNWETEIYNCLRDSSIKELINLVVSWAYGYNSNDTWLYHEWRHPLAKLRDYIWYAYEHKQNEEIKTEIEWMKKCLWDVKSDLEVDEYLEGCNDIKDFISSLEANNETSEQW